MRQHDGPGLGDCGVRDRGRGHCGDPLFGLRWPRPAEKQVLGDFAGELRISVPPDPRNHQVEDGRSARAADSLAASHIELSNGPSLRVVFLKADGIVPMHGNRMSVEQPGLGEQQAAVFDPTDLDPELCDALEPANDLPFAHAAVRIEARQNKDCLAVRGAIEIAVHRDQPSIAGANRLAVRGDDSPVEHRALGQPVCDEQRLRRGGDPEIGKFRQEQEGHFAHRAP